MYGLEVYVNCSCTTFAIEKQLRWFVLKDAFLQKLVLNCTKCFGFPAHWRHLHLIAPPPLTRCPEIGTCITSSSCSGVTAFTVGRHFCFLLSVPTPATDLQQPARLLLSLTSRGFWRIPISSSWPSSLFSPDMVSKEFAASNEHAASRTRLRLLTMKEVSHVHLRRLPERQSRSSVIDAASLLSPEAVNTDAVF